MKPNKSPTKGLTAFNAFFADIYQDRWPHLRESLIKEAVRSALINPRAVLEESQTKTITGTENGKCPPPFLSHTGLMSHYVLDRASVLAALALPIKKGDRVLDMCAAPGGKALTMLFSSDESIDFVLNERSASRRARLKKVIETYLPDDRKNKVKITAHDATRWGLHEKEAFDAILLDAPCSSERHLLEQPSLLSDWSPRRTRTLAIQQYAMLAAAFTAVKPGGYILYATCSISPAENDEVISKLLKKRDQCAVETIQFKTGEATKHGWIFLPDACSLGPLYACLIRRKA